MNLDFEFSPANTNCYKIPLNEIHLATQTFSSQARIGGGRSLDVYVGRLSARWQNRLAVFRRLHPNNNQNTFAFNTEVGTGIICSHENIVSFIGYYYDEGKELITVYEYCSNDRLDEYLRDTNKRRSLTWVQRLKICIGAARGLAYLHRGFGEGFTVIHRNVSSAKIWLDDNMEAKIGGLDMAILRQEGKPAPFIEYGVPDPSYKDPKYKENGIIKTESDIYSYGMVMFEMLTGMMIYESKSLEGNPPRRETLKDYVLQYNDEALNSLIDPHLRDQIDIHSFQAFKNIAYECISLNPNNRPTMNNIKTRLMNALDYLQNRGTSSTSTSRSPQHRNLQSYLIPLNLIKWVTQNFSSNNQIGDGGFGVVYKANLSIGGQISTVAVKRLNPKGHQGEQEFRTELKLFCRFQHPNIIPFIGYCDEEKEMIMVSKYAVNGSLDQYLEDDPYKRGSLTWAQRLKICLGAARGLEYIHSRQGLVIHRDIKSANLLLDENLEAKICDFGLSKEGIRNQDTHLFTKAAGTQSYIDPIYQESGILRKESDVYSFGIVLFEMLSGMLAYRPKRLGDGGPQLLINLVRRYYIEGPEMLIDPIIRDQIDKRCFQTFKDTAYACISYNLEERPTMETICYKITAALELQVKVEKTYLESAIQHPSKQQQSSSYGSHQMSALNLEGTLSHHFKKSDF